MSEKTSKIRFTIKLDENNIPTDIKWIASDSQNKEGKTAKSMMINLWDPADKNTLSINLWTQEMQTDEMHVHFYQSLLSMADAFSKATGNTEAVDDIKAWCDQFDAKVQEKFDIEQGNK